MIENKGNRTTLTEKDIKVLQFWSDKRIEENCQEGNAANEQTPEAN